MTTLPSTPARKGALPHAEWDEIRRGYEAGASLGSLSREHNISVQTISRRRDKYGWLKAGEVDPVAAAIAASGNAFDTADSSSETYADLQVPTVDPRDAELAELRAELAKFKPVKVEWAVDEQTAARMLADEMHMRIEAALNGYNLERVRAGAPPGSALSLKEMEQVQPGWYEREKTRIIRETVDALTKHATNQGQATRTLAMRKRDGIIVKAPLDEGIGNYGLSPQIYLDSLKAKGQVELTPQPCTRQDCWAPVDRNWLIKGGLPGVTQPMGYCGELHYRLDPYADNGGISMRATTTKTFSL